MPSGGSLVGPINLARGFSNGSRSNDVDDTFVSSTLDVVLEFLTGFEEELEGAVFCPPIMANSLFAF